MAGRVLVVAMLTLAAGTVEAQNMCSGTGVMAGEAFAVSNCAVAIFPDQKSVTLWFNETPITPREQEAFEASAYADSAKDGKDRTMLLVMFCPGGGQAAAAAAAIKSMDLELTHAKSAAASAQWMVQAQRDFKVDTISGDVNPGGKLAGHITGSRSSDGRKYAWDLTFDLTLPAKAAASGMTCRK